MASIQKRKNGSWRARYKDRDGVEHAKHFTKKRDAQNWLDTITASLVTGTYIDPKAGQVLFETYARDWMSRQIWELTTQKTVSSSITATPFKHLPIKTIRKRDIEIWVHRQNREGLSPRTIRTRFGHINSIFRAAINEQIIINNPMTGIRLPNIPKRQVTMHFPTPQELGKVINISPPRLKAAIALGAFAGLRCSEILGIQPHDIDTQKQLIHVRRQVQRDPTGGRLSRLPKYGAVRTIPVCDTALELILPHLNQHQLQEQDWVFKGPTDLPIAPDHLRYSWYKALKNADIPKYRLHDLRHFYASGLIAAGCDVVTVQHALGHSNATITLGTYSHLWPTSDEQTRKALKGLLEKTLH